MAGAVVGSLAMSACTRSTPATPPSSASRSTTASSTTVPATTTTVSRTTVPRTTVPRTTVPRAVPPTTAQPITTERPPDPTIAAAGDIACDPSRPGFNGGN